MAITTQNQKSTLYKQHFHNIAILEATLCLTRFQPFDPKLPLEGVFPMTQKVAKLENQTSEVQ